MAVVVVGGHTRNIGKTSAVSGLIAALPTAGWTAIKITQYGHGVCSADGAACGCATDDHSVAISEERNRAGKTDTSRYLVAGAERAFWVRTRQGQLFEAMPRLRQLLDQPGNFIIESNSVIQFLRPDVFLSVLDGAVQDFKGSARRYLDRADGVLWNEQVSPEATWCSDLRGLLAKLQLFPFTPPRYVGDDVRSFVAARIGLPVTPQSSAPSSYDPQGLA